jgi:hypothetical protein
VIPRTTPAGAERELPARVQSRHTRVKRPCHALAKRLGRFERNSIFVFIVFFEP